jgi:heme A synthase
VLALAAMLAFFARRGETPRRFRRLAAAIPETVVAQMLIGAGLAYLSMPPAMQVLHLGAASILFALNFTLVVLVARAKRTEEVSLRIPA